MMDGQAKYYCAICQSISHPTESHPQKENTIEQEGSQDFEIEMWELTEGEKVLEARWKHRHGAEKWTKEIGPEPRALEFLKINKGNIGPEILDIGCGYGRHLVPLAKAGYKVTGIDISEDGLIRALQILKEEGLDKQNSTVKLVRGGFKNLKFPDASFDTGISTLVLHNNTWEGAQKSFGEIARVLKPGGLFFFMVRSTTNTHPDNMKVLEQGPQGMTWMREKDAGDVDSIMHDFTLESIRMLAAQNGFEIVGEPVDERYDDKKHKGPGQWCVTFRKIIEKI